jgi:D-3-phosphoglycerate dehydrogenase
MRTKIECPTEFLRKEELRDLLFKYGCSLSEDPLCLIVNPGTNFYLDERYFSKFESLKIVGTPSTGVSHMDTKYLEDNNIEYRCLLDNRNTLENIHASAEFTWMHIMNCFRKFTMAAKRYRYWRTQTNEELLRSNELAGKKIGIIGMGRIGRKIAKYAAAFEMDICYYDPYVDNENHKKVKNIDELKDCDIISINCYLTKETKNLISNDIFEDFKDGLIVVNTSRGEVVNEEYIYELINSGKIIYSCDVLCNEQNMYDLKKSKLFKLNHDNFLVTPHVAGATVESQTKALKGIIEACIK